MQTNSIETHHSTTLQYVHWFRHSAPYINAHRNKTFVIMFDGEAVQHDNFQHIIHDIALLHSLGIRLILVHGARPQINHNLKQSQLQTPFHQHRRHHARIPGLRDECGGLNSFAN
jgi:amino-acid N-acetyltransferase